MKIATSEPNWRIPSSPIVGEKHVVSLCKLGKCPNPLFYRCKFLPRLNRDCFFDFSGKTRMKIIASEVHWRLPSPPIVREKHVICLCKLGKCPNPLFYRCKFFPRLKHDCFFDFSGKTRTKTRASEGHWRLPSPPIVKCLPLYLTFTSDIHI